MSILKHVLSEAWLSVARKSPSQEHPDRIPGTKPATGEIIPVHHAVPQLGMKVVILNWKAGENDPFTVANETIRQHLHACGKNAEVIEITDLSWPATLAQLASTGVEFAFTWQGLGSHIMVGDGNQSLWDQLKIPLICIHGDHPSHMPRNHWLESRYCFHLYNNAESARYSNRHFRTKRSASVIDIPQLHRETRLKHKSGDYFVVAKNIYDPATTESAWRQRLTKQVLDAYIIAAETLKARIASELYVDLHDALDEVIIRNELEWLTPGTNISAYHEYHSALDHYLRSYKTVTALNSLREFPVRIYGRGWDRIAQTAPAIHVFERGRNMADSQDLYYSKYGLVDVSPSKGLHDRTRRAMANGTGFLSSANMEDSFADIERFSPLFFSFGVNDLPEKAATVVRDPEAHAVLAQQFGFTYHNRFHFKAFVNRLDHLAKLASGF